MTSEEQFRKWLDIPLNEVSEQPCPHCERQTWRWIIVAYVAVAAAVVVAWFRF